MEKFELPENVTLNPDENYVKKLYQVMERNGGYCPCRIQHTPENICPCAEFRGQLADPAFKGYCHCKLYEKH